MADPSEIQNRLRSEVYATSHANHEQTEAPLAQPSRNKSGNDAPDRVGGGSLFGVGSGAVFDVG